MTHPTIRKESEIWPIPQEWEVLKLGDFANLIMGQSPEGENYNSEWEWMPFMQWNRTFWDKYNKIDTRTKKTTKVWKKGSVLMSVRAPVWSINISISDLCIWRWLCSIESKNWENEFLYYLLQANKSLIVWNESWTVFWSVNKNQLEWIEFVLPPLAEQQVIASILWSLDDKIELLREQNRTLEKMGQTMFYESFGKYSVEDELPEGWRVGKLGDIVDNFDSKRIPLSNMERAKRKWKYPYYGATSIMDYVDDYIFDWIYTLIGEDGSVMNKEWKPFTQYVWWKIRVNNHAHVLQGKNGFSTEMIKIILDSTDIAPYVNWAVQPKINQSNMNSIPVIIPNDEILQEFSEIIDPIFCQIRVNSDQIVKLIQARDNLLPRLMSGKMRVI
jgi:type I restriction enzyme, S subunit